MSRHQPTVFIRHRRQGGVALLTALIFLVVLTLLGIGVFSTTTSEERMARNFRDKEIALHAAEAALNEAKILITGSYPTGATAAVPISEERCFVGTPPGFSCDPTIVAATLDLFSGPTGVPIGQVDSTRGNTTDSTRVSPLIQGLNSGIQPRYLVIWRNRAMCGASGSDTNYCFQIVAQGRGRLANTRVDLVELFTN